MTRPRARAAWFAACLAIGVGADSARAVETILQNDGFVDGQPVGFQGGFVVGERAGSRLTPAGPFPMQVTRVQFLFGGAAGTRTITLRIWNDPGPGSATGVELFSGDYSVTASNTNMQEIDLTAEGIFVSGQFRVGIEFQHSGLPSVARDGDGNIQAARNYIYTSGTWFDSQFFGLTGDWVIRAGVDGAPTGPGNEPAILTVLDVGNDQGRQARVRFERSAQDEAGAPTPITHYEVHRRVDAPFARTAPLFGTMLLDGWDYVASVPAHGDAIYSVVVPTLADSTIADGMHWTAFFVRAATAAPLVFFDSEPDSGYSLDNLAPGAPQNVMASATIVAWDPASEADFDYFTVYGSDSPTLDPGAVQLAQTTQTEFDADGLSYEYILITATDFSGNEGPAAAADLATGVRIPDAERAPLRVQPNPFAARATVSFDLPRPQVARVSVYDAAGRAVRTLANGPLAMGRHAVDWDGRDGSGRPAANGVYMVRLETDDFADQRKIVLLR